MVAKGIKNLKVGQNFTGFCIIRKKELKYKQNGDPYLSLELGDHSGRLRAKLWKNVNRQFENLKIGQIIKIQGKIQNFLDTKEMHIDRLRHTKKDDEIHLDNLIPKSEKNIPQLIERYKNHTASLKNGNLIQLLEKLFPDEDTLLIYLKSPSGKLWHHNYLYGVLEHVVCLLDLSDIMYIHYPQLDIELLKVAIIIQFLGNKHEFETEGFIEYTDEGRLLGHVAIDYDLTRKAIDEVDAFPTDLRLKLLHLILSRESRGEEGSAIPPMMLEGIVLNHLIQLDIQANAAQRIIKNDRLPDSNWTKYNNLFNRFLYVGDKPKNKKNTNKRN